MLRSVPSPQGRRGAPSSRRHVAREKNGLQLAQALALRDELGVASLPLEGEEARDEARGALGRGVVARLRVAECVGESRLGDELMRFAGRRLGVPLGLLAPVGAPKASLRTLGPSGRPGCAMIALVFRGAEPWSQ